MDLGSWGELFFFSHRDDVHDLGKQNSMRESRRVVEFFFLAERKTREGGKIPETWPEWEILRMGWSLALR
jgi:hypothetical protein